jgi:N-acetyltransferase 10
MDDAARELGLPTPQVMALFNKAVRKMHAALRAGKTREVEADMPKESALPNLNPHAVGLDEDLEDGYVSTRLAFFGFSRHSRSLRSRLADAPGTTKMRRDGSDGYNPGRRSPEVASAGATVYSGL